MIRPFSYRRHQSDERRRRTVMGRLTLLLALLHITVPAHGLYKRWIKNTNFGDPNNWNAGRAPCGNDVVIIPDESPVVYIQTNTTLKELALPNNGEIIFGRNAILSFTSDPSPGCPSSGGDLEYIVSAPRAWTDPSNWCPAPTETGDCGSPPLLDTEKIPCATDDTVFPRGEAFYVDLGTGLDINVKSLKLSGKSFTTNTFRTYVQSTDGQRIFPPPLSGQGSPQSSVSVSRQACGDPTGCACGNDQGQIYKKICSAYSKKCDRAMCKVPFKPVGNCCDACGAVFNGTVGTGFNIDDFRNILQQFITNKKDNGTVKLMVSKTGEGFIQAVLTGDNGDTSITVAKAIKADMDIDAQSGGHKYRLKDIQLMESSGAIEPTPPDRHTGSIGGGGIAGIVIVLIAVAVLLVLGLLFYRKRTGKSNNMIDDLTAFPSRIRRSMPRGRRVPDEITRNPHYEIEMDQGFENPIYGDIGGIENSASDVRPMTLMPAEVQPTFDNQGGDSGFNNPLYDTIKQDGTFKDPGSTSVTLKQDSRHTDSDL